MPKTTIIKNIKTELGNNILKTLISEGWIVVNEYSPWMFDKSIDYDSYTLKKAEQTLDFIWDNWFEWEIHGPKTLLATLATRFELQ